MNAALRSIAVLVAVTVLTSVSGFSAFFVGDDFDFLRLVERMDGMGEALTLSFWGEWEPLWYLSWYVDFKLWGFNPEGFHATNTFWLVVLVVCLFGLLRVLRPDAPIVAWSAALLFATHPLHDEAVIYLAARGHLMAAALSVAALLSWAEARRRRSSEPRMEKGLLLVALVLAFLAGLAKEIALTLPAWAAMLAWAEAPARPRRRAGIAAVRTAGLFAIPGVATLVLRFFVVGFESGKLTRGFDDPVRIVVDAFEQLPIYAVLGGLPLPFAFLNYETVDRFRGLGFLLIAFALLGWLVPVARCLWRGQNQSPRLALYGFGLAIFASSFAPVFWAALPIRRRYEFIPSIGAVILAALVIDLIAERSRRAAVGLLAILVVAGGIGMQQRNALYRGAGEVTRGLVESVRGAPLGHPATRRPARVVFLTLPRAYGGDSLSGAYLLHHTDASSALRLAGVDDPQVRYALKCEHADDYSAETTSGSADSLEMRVRYRTAQAFEASLARNPEDDRRGHDVVARRTAVDVDTRSIEYEIRFAPGAREAIATDWYVYSDRGFRILGKPGAD